MAVTFAQSGIWMVAAGVFLAAALIWQYVSLRTRLAPVRALAVVALRGTVFVFLIVFLADPVLIRERREYFRPAVAVGIDTSLSMGISGGLETPRIERVKNFLGSSSFAGLTEEFYPYYFSFADGFRRVDDNVVPTLQAEGRWTDVAGALARITGEEGVDPGAILLFTDSSHESEDLPAPVGGVMPPVILVAVDDDEEEKDVQVIAVDAADIAFTGRQVDLTVFLRGRGYEGKELPLLLKEGGKVVSSKNLVFQESGEEQQVEMSWSPPGAGRYQLTVEIPPQAGEEISLNNAVSVPVEVRRDKIRILLVSGRPSWNYRFIRDALKGDPTVDLISFIILRSANDIVNVPQDELSLIPFPTKKIFLEELENFDLVIFENFSYRLFFPPQYLDKVAEFVEKGGGFWMLGGPLSFAGGAYAGTAVGDLLPVDIRNMNQDRGFETGRYRAQVTPGGERHPLLRGLGKGGGAGLPHLDGFNPTSGVKDQSFVLFEGITDLGSGGPLLVLGRHGRGRTLALMTDSFWKWNFEMAGRGRGNTFFLSLLRQSVRWTVGDPLMEPVRIVLPVEKLTAGDDLEGTVKVFSEDFLPAHDPSVTVELWRGRNLSALLPLERMADGIFSFAHPVPAVGGYEVRAAVRKGDYVYGEDAANFSVSWPTEEFRGEGMGPEAMAAELTKRGHSVVVLGGEEETAVRIEESLRRMVPPYRVLTEERRGIGEEWWAFLLLFGLLTTEWVTRRRFNLE